MSATTTRKITNELRDMHGYISGITYRLANWGDDNKRKPSSGLDTRWGIRLSRQSGERAYWLEHGASLRAGISVAINSSTRAAWIRPASRGDGSQAMVDMAWRRMAAETLLIDAMIDALEVAGYTLDNGSETRESLAEWRESRRFG